MMWDLTMDWYNRVYSCTKIAGGAAAGAAAGATGAAGAGAAAGADYYKCKRFHSVEAANMYRSYMRLNDVPLLYMCRFTPLVIDSTILKIKLKEKVVLY